MSRLLRSGAVISAMTLISRILGLVRDMIVARYFPVDGATDAFFVAFKIPNLLRRFFAEGAFSLAFVPVLAEYKEKRSREELSDLIDHVAGALGLLLLIISLIGMVAAPILVYLFAPGFTKQAGAQPELAAEMLRITFPYILFISLAGLAGGILNTFQKFAVPAFTPSLLNIIMIIATVWVAPYFGQPILVLAWGVFFAGLAQFLFQVPSLIRLGLMPKFKFKKAHEGVKRIMQLMLPAIFGSSVAQINLVINTIIASFLVVGSISWLYYSDRFIEFPLAIIGVALGTVILPKLSGDHARADSSEFQKTLDWALRLALLIAIPSTLGLILLAEPILATVMMHGQFQWGDVQMSAMSLMTYSLGLPAFILVKVLAPGFYSRQDTKTPVKIGVISVIANMLLNIIIVVPWYFSGFIGAHAGLSLATALAGYVNAGMLFMTLRRQGMFSASQGWWAYVARIALASLVMVVLVWLIKPEWLWWRDAPTTERVAWLIALIIASLVSYFSTLSLSGMPLRQMLGR
ncbi:murein biosynthesis integral membrane protein MurJ [Thiolinea disciformis]|uniref:murein biosynthesis integral membrane protein MurJ n=1 Tax=Thiolinea disciformis TaxID=125614 RepID=UPI0003A8DDDD|nr:murein biosynthesis integral membrane protein MurJ [Thiolinea disciformis]